MKKKYVNVRLNFDDYHDLVALKKKEKKLFIRNLSMTNYISYLIDLKKQGIIKK